MSEFEFTPKENSEYVSIFSLWDKRLGFIHNIKYLLIEMLFGIQIVELLTDTNSLELSRSGPTKLSDAGNSDNGMIAGLSKFIPATLMTKHTERSIAEMIHAKYFGTYGFIIVAKENYKPSGSSSETAVAETLYRLNKLNAHQLVPYKGKINLIWTSVETAAATITWVTTKSLEITLLITGLLEFARRFRI